MENIETLKSYLHNCRYDDTDIEYCINYVKENMLFCVKNKNPFNKVVQELFKRGFSKRWSEK
jgi:aminopeptidase-like protein